jgi:accessory gene regulator protein AgrB
LHGKSSYVSCSIFSSLLIARETFRATDANAQMALLQFISAGLSTVRVPTSVHADHLITAKHGDRVDMIEAERVNKEVYKFLESACAKVSSLSKVGIVIP